MKSFLVKNKTPVTKWGSLKDNTFFEGNVPEGFKLAVSPSENYIVIDVDRHGNVDGFENIPSELLSTLDSTLNYRTKNNGKHYWFKYNGDKILMNKTSGQGIDLRTNRGYVVWYPTYDLRNNLYRINETTPMLNLWLESLFGPINTKCTA